MKLNKIFVFASAFLALIVLTGNVSAFCHTYKDAASGTTYKAYSLDPGQIDHVSDPEYTSDYMDTMKSSYKFTPKLPFSPGDSITFSYSTRLIDLDSECYGEDIESTDPETGAPIKTRDPWYYFVKGCDRGLGCNLQSGFNPGLAVWSISLEDESGKVYAKQGVDTITSQIWSNYQSNGMATRMALKGEIRFVLEPWFNEVFDENKYNELVDALDAGKKMKLVIRSTYDDVSGFPEEGIIKEIKLPMSNCKQIYGEGPIKIVDTHVKSAISHYNFRGLGASLALGIINSYPIVDYISSPPQNYQNKFSFYEYLGDESKSESGKCSSAKMYRVYNIGNEKKEGNKIYVGLSAEGSNDFLKATKYLHAFGHGFDLQDEGTNGVEKQSINNLRTLGDNRWREDGFLFSQVDGPGDFVITSLSSVMNLNNPANKFNLVSCALILSVLKKESPRSPEILKTCFNNGNNPGIVPSSSSPFILPDKTGFYNGKWSTFT